jgi:hypothetical protein
VEGWKPSDPTASIINADVASVANGKANLTVHGDSVPAVPWFGPYPAVGGSYPVIRQGASMLMLTDTAGHARGTLNSKSIAPSSGSSWDSFTFTDQHLVTQNGASLTLGRRGYWQASMSVGWGVALSGRNFLTILGPDPATGAGSTGFGPRASVGQGEDGLAMTAVFYSDGGGGVEFRLFHTHSSAVTASGHFFCKYLGGE